MDAKTIKKAVAMGKRLGTVLVATADASGLPHVAVAGKIRLSAEGSLTLSAWFCPGTLTNLKVNPRLALVIWDPRTDTGYQLLGESQKVEDLAILNGYAPEVEGSSPIPQVERELVLRVDKILEFRHAPHSDLEE